MDEAARKYLAILARISGYAMSEAARAAILAQIEAIYTAEWGAWRATPTGSPPAV